MDGRGYKNAPKYQPCPKCRANSKRVKKLLTSGHAAYHCKIHGEFTVRG